jgi:hypothetical protein
MAIKLKIMYINTCCGWETNYPTELCPECLEHCDWEDLDEEELEQDKQNENQIEENKLNKI